MNRDSSIIPKIIGILAFLSVTWIILLFFIPRLTTTEVVDRPEVPEKLFAQVIQASKSKILHLWEEGDAYISKSRPLLCPEEILPQKNVGGSYYQCQPHFWQCYWAGGVKDNFTIKVDLFGQTYNVRAKAAYNPIPQYSSQSRFYQIVKGPFEGMSFHYGMQVELAVDEIPGLSWPIILTDTCRDTYLPERIYGYGKLSGPKDLEGFIWDNFDRKIFVDRFYVTNQQANEWRLLTRQANKIISDRALWPAPALLDLKEQQEYCHFFGKRVLEAKLFDAASMSPIDTKDPFPNRVLRPQTPWQRDISKTFLGMARINPDYQLTPLDCQLAQVKGCALKHFTTDSVSWMGMNFALGFYPESVINDIEQQKNLKPSSRFELAQSEKHELGMYTNWNGEQDPQYPVAFRCYEEVGL